MIRDLDDNTIKIEMLRRTARANGNATWYHFARVEVFNLPYDRRLVRLLRELASDGLVVKVDTEGVEKPAHLVITRAGIDLLQASNDAKKMELLHRLAKRLGGSTRTALMSEPLWGVVDPQGLDPVLDELIDAGMVELVASNEGDPALVRLTRAGNEARYTGNL
jgi:hypothetical protein